MDRVALGAYLERTQGLSVTNVEILGDGLNLVAEVHTRATDNPYILRRPNALRETPWFNSLRTEYRLLEHLVPTPIPAAEPVAYCEDTAVLGDEFCLTTALPGSILEAGNPSSTRLETADRRRALSRRVIETLGAIHATDPTRFESVCESRSPMAQLAIAADRIEHVEAQTNIDVPALHDAIRRLRADPPPPQDPRLVHGDFAPDNVLFAFGDVPAVTGVLDWETAYLGDHRTDLGYLLLHWGGLEDSLVELALIVERYPDSAGLETVRLLAADGLWPFSARPGAPDRSTAVEWYESAAGIPLEHLTYFRAHAAVGLATVWADIHRHLLETGNQSEREPQIEYLARVAQALATRR